jgi:hypothetical protein
MSFETGKGSSNTIVDASSKAKMLVVSAVWVKSIRLDETRRVTAARGKQKDHSCTLWDSNTSYIDICESRTDAKVNWRIKAQYLFDHTFLFYFFELCYKLWFCSLTWFC